MNRIEKWLVEKLSESDTPSMMMGVDMSYELKTVDGKLKSTGSKYIDFWGNIHFIQKDGNGKKIAETISRPDGTLAEAIRWDEKGRKISHLKWKKE